MTAKDIELTHKPVVFISESIPPVEGSDDAMRWNFALFNSGSLPARNVTAKCMISQVAGTNKGIDNTFLFPVRGKATIYPNSTLIFSIPNYIDFGQPVTQAEALFTISYTSDINKDDIYYETMKWLFAPETGNKWVYVGPEINLGIE
jgi:hypothetical protein